MGSAPLSRRRTNVAGRIPFVNFGRAALVALLFAVLQIMIAAPGQALEKKPLSIITASGQHNVTVEVALTREEQAAGLMYRTELGDDEGMLFFYPQEFEITMWMKNTYIPLDMIFVKRDGTVLRVEENTEPFSERVISSHGKARAVIELKGGSAARLGIRPGDKIKYGSFQ